VGLRDKLRGKRTPEEAFSDEIARLAKELIGVQRVRPVPEFSLELTHADGRSTVMYLGTVFAEASSLEGVEREDRLRQAVLAMEPSERPVTWEEAAPRLRPAVRAAGWTAAAATGEHDLVRWPFLPFLLGLIAIDDRHGLTFVSDEDLAKWGVPVAKAAAAGVEGLVRSEIPVYRPEGGEPWLDVLGPAGFASSWLAVPEVLEHPGAPLGAGYVVFAPSRDQLRLVGTDDAAELAVQFGWALETYESAPRQLSPVAYTVIEGDIAPWVPPAGHPCTNAAEEAQRTLGGVEYTYQEAVLTELFDRAGENVYVAQYGVVREPDGTTWSWSAWVRQFHVNLLPRTDFVVLGDSDTSEWIKVRWEDIEVVAPGALVEEPGYYPPRWRGGHWPPESVVQGLRELGEEMRND
jgi:hypothetical protein